MHDEHENDLGGHESHGGREDLEPAAPSPASHAETGEKPRAYMDGFNDGWAHALDVLGECSADELSLAERIVATVGLLVAQASDNWSCAAVDAVNRLLTEQKDSITRADSAWQEERAALLSEIKELRGKIAERSSAANT